MTSCTHTKKGYQSDDFQKSKCLDKKNLVHFDRTSASASAAFFMFHTMIAQFIMAPVVLMSNHFVKGHTGRCHHKEWFSPAVYLLITAITTAALVSLFAGLVH